MSKLEDFRERLSAPAVDHGLNVLIYGDTGVGKTMLAGSAAAFGPTSPTLIIDVEGGTSTLKGQKQIEVFRPRTWADLQEVYDVLYNEDHGFNAVVVDSLTEIQRKLSMGTILGDLVDGDDYYGDLARTVVPDRQDWHRTGEQMRKFIRAFRDLAWQEDEGRRVHVIMTALEKLDEKRRLVSPELPGKLGSGAGAFVDVLARLSVVPIEEEDEEGRVRIRTRRHLLVSAYRDQRGTNYLAKNRGGLMGVQMWDPTIERMLGVWLGDEEPDEDLATVPLDLAGDEADEEEEVADD